MPRIRRMVINDETTVYHVMSRTALDGFPLGDMETPVKFATLVFCEELNRVKKILCWI
jgi:putative transposase